VIKIETFIDEPKKGLEERIFLFISKLTPMVNVDLLIKNEKNQTLLTYRDDGFYKGWHIPGGIVRFKETFEERLVKVAKLELNCEIEYEKEPLIFKQLIHKNRNYRGHFISFLYKCKLKTPLNENLKCTNLNNPKPNEWAWFNKAPDNLIKVHNIYKKYFK